MTNKDKKTVMWMADEPNNRQQLIIKGVYLRTKKKAKPTMGQNRTGCNTLD